MRQPAGSAWRTQHVGVYLGVNLVLTLLVASIVFRFVEQPAIRIGHRLARSREAKVARAKTRVAHDAPSAGIAEASAG
jgi:peptidoglycan/LPS O-acetylase OafA/YrhL